MQMIFPIRKNVCNLMHENAGKSRLSAQLGDAGLYPASKIPDKKANLHFLRLHPVAGALAPGKKKVHR